MNKDFNSYDVRYKLNEIEINIINGFTYEGQLGEPRGYSYLILVQTSVLCLVVG